MHKARWAALAVVLVTLGACGDTRTDRALSGAGIGAAAGALGAAAVDGSIGAGAVIGGLAGGAVGAATDSRDIDLGRPVWDR
ncbi:MAG: hypothetical protein AAF415_06795 [Pseudomonadota bacterium]